MKKKTLFYLLITMVSIGFIGIITTLVLALIFGSSQNAIIDFSNLNFVNIGIVMAIGLVFVCFILTIILLIIAKIGVEKIFDFIKNKKWED